MMRLGVIGFSVDCLACKYTGFRRITLLQVHTGKRDQDRYVVGRDLEFFAILQFSFCIFLF